MTFGRLAGWIKRHFWWGSWLRGIRVAIFISRPQHLPLQHDLQHMIAPSCTPGRGSVLGLPWKSWSQHVVQYVVRGVFFCVYVVRCRFFCTLHWLVCQRVCFFASSFNIQKTHTTWSESSWRCVRASFCLKPDVLMTSVSRIYTSQHTLQLAMTLL